MHEVKKGQNKIFLFLAILSLTVFLIIVIGGTLKGRYTFFLKRGGGGIVLGVANKLSISQVSQEKIENMFEGAVSTAKNELGKKAVEVEAQVKEQIAREVKDMTSAQIKAIQTNICREWGVVNPTSGQ